MLRKLLIAFVLPVVIYAGVALFVTYPLVTQLSTDVIGTQFTDSFEFVRGGWWGAYALQHHLSPFYQSMYAYPNGFFSTVQIPPNFVVLGFIYFILGYSLFAVLSAGTGAISPSARPQREDDTPVR